MRCFISKTDEGFAVYVDIVATLCRGIGIGTAANSVDAGIIFTTSAKAIDENVSGGIDNGSDTGMWTNQATVCITGNKCKV